jgi:hypothetical protein
MAEALDLFVAGSGKDFSISDFSVVTRVRL